MLSISNGPAGSTPFGAARDLLALARMHLAGGVAEDGTRVLSEASVRAMQEVEFELPAGSMTPAWGLGWMLHDWGGERVIGHDGGTLGQASALRIHPASGVSMALLMNGGNSAALSRRVQEEVFGALADIGPPPLPEPSGITIDAERYVGSYERLAVRQIVSAEGGTLTLRTESLQSPIEEAPQEVTLQPISESLFEFRPAGTSFRNHASFLEPDAKGRPAYLHTGGRSTPRVS